LTNAWLAAGLGAVVVLDIALLWIVLGTTLARRLDERNAARRTGVADGGALSSGFTQYVNKIGPFATKRPSKDSTAFNATVESFLRGIVLRHEPITIEGMYDDTATTGPDAVLDINKITHAATRSVVMTLAAGKTVSGEVWIEEYNITQEFDEYHAYAAVIRFTGTVTVT
jgi:hypothetical protein